MVADLMARASNHSARRVFLIVHNSTIHRGKRAITRLSYACLLLALAACRDDQPAPAPSTTPTGSATLVAEVILQESDSVFVGRPSGIAVSPSGLIAVGDALERRVLVFHPDGRRKAIVGRKGGGPGEFVTTSFVAFTTDSTMVVSDFAQRRLSLFSLTDSVRFVRQVVLSGEPNYIQRRSDNAVLMGLLKLDPPTLLAEWRTSEDSIRTYLQPPQELIDGKMLQSSAPDAMTALHRDGMTVATLGVHYAVRYQGETLTPVDTFHVPAVRRRGLPDFDARLMALGMEAHRIYDEISLLQNIGALSDDRVAFVHFDMTARGQWPINEAAWVSVVSLRDGSACADIPLPVRAESRARVTFHRDTLVLIDQGVDADSRAQTVVSKYRVSTEGCEWLPTDGSFATFRGAASKEE